MPSPAPRSLNKTSQPASMPKFPKKTYFTPSSSSQSSTNKNVPKAKPNNSSKAPKQPNLKQQANDTSRTCEVNVHVSAPISTSNKFEELENEEAMEGLPNPKMNATKTRITGLHATLQTFHFQVQNASV